PLLTALPLCALGAYFLMPGLYGFVQSVALFGFFIFVVHGTSLFGLLRTRGGQAYWLLAALAAAGCVLLSAFTYRYVEYPFLHPQSARKPERAHAEAVS